MEYRTEYSMRVRDEEGEDSIRNFQVKLWAIAKQVDGKYMKTREVERQDLTLPYQARTDILVFWQVKMPLLVLIGTLKPGISPPPFFSEL